MKNKPQLTGNEFHFLTAADAIKVLTLMLIERDRENPEKYNEEGYIILNEAWNKIYDELRTEVYKSVTKQEEDS